MKFDTKNFLVFLFIISSVFISGCIAGNFVRIKEGLDKKESEGHYINGLTFFKQERYTCGPAVLATVFGFWQEDIKQKEISDAIYFADIKGTLTFDLEDYAYSRGYFSQSIQSDIYSLAERIKSGIPVIVMFQNLPLIKRYHYLVAFGYDDTNEVILIYTGKEEPELISYFNFTRKWKSAHNWMLTVCPPEKVDWELDAYYSNRLGFLYEEKGNLNSAKKAYQEAVNKDIENPTYLYNLANIYLKENDFKTAGSFYEKVIVLDKEFADAYNNLAYSLLNMNEDLERALSLAREAGKLNPKNSIYYLDTQGLIYLEKEFFDEAILKFKEALKLLKPQQKVEAFEINRHLKQALKLKEEYNKD